MLRIAKEYLVAHRDEINERKRKSLTKREYDIAYWKTHKAEHKKYRETHIESIKDSILRRTRGITLAQYYQMLDLQNNRCAICNKKLKRISKFTHVDHEHKTGKVRQILCGTCNSGLGYFKENSKLLCSTCLSM